MRYFLIQLLLDLFSRSSLTPLVSRKHGLIIHSPKHELTEWSRFERRQKKIIWLSKGTLKYLEMRVNNIPYGRLTLTTSDAVVKMFQMIRREMLYLIFSWRQYKIIIIVASTHLGAFVLGILWPTTRPTKLKTYEMWRMQWPSWLV